MCIVETRSQMLCPAQLRHKSQAFHFPSMVQHGDCVALRTLPLCATSHQHWPGVFPFRSSHMVLQGTAQCSWGACPAKERPRPGLQPHHTWLTASIHEAVPLGKHEISVLVRVHNHCNVLRLPRIRHCGTHKHQQKSKRKHQQKSRSKHQPKSRQTALLAHFRAHLQQER